MEKKSFVGGAVIMLFH